MIDKLIALLVCSICKSPVMFDKEDKVYRHREPQEQTAAKTCPKFGYPVNVVIG